MVRNALAFFLLRQNVNIGSPKIRLFLNNLNLISPPLNKVLKQIKTILPPLQMTSESHLPSQNYLFNRLLEIKYMAHQGSPKMDRKTT